MVFNSTLRQRLPAQCPPAPCAVTPARVPRLTPTSPTIRSTTHQGRRGAMEKSELYSAHSRLRKVSFGTAKTLHFLFAVIVVIAGASCALAPFPSRRPTSGPDLSLPDRHSFSPQNAFSLPAALLTPPPQHNRTERASNPTPPFLPCHILSVCLSVCGEPERKREGTRAKYIAKDEGGDRRTGRTDALTSLLMEVELFYGEY